MSPGREGFNHEPVHRYHHFEEAMIEQARLLDFTRSEQGRAYLDGFQASMNAQHPPHARMPPGFFHQIQHRTLHDGEPIYVSERALEIVEHAYPSFEPEQLLASDPFVPIGFALLPRVVWFDDSPASQGGRLPIRALSWMPLHSDDLSVGCYWISLYIHYQDEDYETVVKTYGEAGAAERNRQMARFPLTLVHLFQWTWGDTPWENPQRLPTVEGEDALETAARAKQQSQFVQAFWRIAAQLVPARERAPRGVWRDAERKGIERRDVTVIRLRRARSAHEQESTGRKIQVSFPVRGHWRNQWYPSIEAHRQIWIAPYLKGDESLPYRETVRGWEFVR